MKYFNMYELCEIPQNEEPFKTRLREEIIDIDNKMHSLSKALSPNSEIKMTAHEARMLMEQYEAMGVYAEILNRRCVYYKITYCNPQVNNHHEKDE